MLLVDWNADGKKGILVFHGEASRSGIKAALIDHELKLTELFPITDGSMRAPSAADMDGDGLPELCCGGDWGDDASVYSHTGTKMFTFAPSKHGTDEAVLADLNKDKHAVLIVGFNGGGGLRAADSAGTEIFRDNRDLGNVWNVEAGDINGDGKLEVLNTDAGGDITVWTSDLKYLKTLTPPDYTAGFAVVDHDGDGKDEILLESGSMIDGEGKEVYRGYMEDGMPFPSLAVTADVSSSDGLETAWAQDSYNDFKIFAQKGDMLYHEGMKEPIRGLISTAGLEGWKPGFLVLLEDGTLIHFGRKGK